MRDMLRRIWKILRRGPITAIAKLYIVAADHWFDSRYGTDTCGQVPLKDLSITSENVERGVRYEPARVVLLRKLFRMIRPLASPDSACVDLGAGKGRVLLVASEFGFTVATGVEFAHELCEIAERNCEAYRRATDTRAEFRIVESDVVEYPIGANDNVFLMFNPFDDVIMEKVLRNISDSLKAHPRKVLVCLYNSPFVGLFERLPEYTKIIDRRYWGYHLVVYSNVVSAVSG